VQQGAFDDLIRKPADEFVTRFINSQRTWGVAAAPVPGSG
jgi:hypothetical protein